MNLLAIFQEFKRIFGICPCCSEVFRLSDAMLFTRDKPPETPFDHLARREALLERQVERFDEQECDLRAQAVARGQSDAQKRLREVCPRFIGHHDDPHDIKVLFHPVQYVAFRGLTAREPTDVEFIDAPPQSKAAERLHQSIDATIAAGNIEWQTYRVGEDGCVTRT